MVLKAHCVIADFSISRNLMCKQKPPHMIHNGAQQRKKEKGEGGKEEGREGGREGWRERDYMYLKGYRTW